MMSRVVDPVLAYPVLAYLKAFVSELTARKSKKRCCLVTIWLWFARLRIFFRPSVSVPYMMCWSWKRFIDGTQVAALKLKLTLWMQWRNLTDNMLYQRCTVMLTLCFSYHQQSLLCLLVLRSQTCQRRQKSTERSKPCSHGVEEQHEECHKAAPAREDDPTHTLTTPHPKLRAIEGEDLAQWANIAVFGVPWISVTSTD